MDEVSTVGGLSSFQSLGAEAYEMVEQEAWLDPHAFQQGVWRAGIAAEVAPGMARCPPTRGLCNPAQATPLQTLYLSSCTLTHPNSQKTKSSVVYVRRRGRFVRQGPELQLGQTGKRLGLGSTQDSSGLLRGSWRSTSSVS